MKIPTKTEIEIALYYWLLWKNVPVIAPNVYVLQGEQDMLAISKAGYASEFEIKMTRADYKADFAKTTTPRHWRGRHVELKHDLLSGKITANNPWQVPKYFWFVVPDGLIGVDDVPPYAGLLSVYFDEWDVARVRVEREAPARKGAVKMPVEVYARISTSLTCKFFRLWTKRKNETPDSP